LNCFRQKRSSLVRLALTDVDEPEQLIDIKTVWSRAEQRLELSLRGRVLLVVVGAERGAELAARFSLGIGSV
jgi:hypothetical protein